MAEAQPDAHRLTRAEAQRIAVTAQLLDADRPDPDAGPLPVVRHLTLVQHDPTAAVVRSADLVLWSRLGASYDVRELERALETGALVELDQLLRPAEDLALHRAAMAAWPGTGEPGEVVREWQVGLRDWVEANDGCRRDILAKLHDEGPLPSRELPDTTVLPWESSGWTHDRSLRRLLGCLVGRGEVAAAGYRGRERLWDLAERVYPDVPVVPAVEARRERDRRRLRALGIARARSPRTPNEPDDVGAAGEPAVVEGVRGAWRVDPTYLPLLEDDPGPGRVAVLSPLDRLVMDRRRLGELWGFDYQLEMYKPAARRRWGYWAMPVLVGDRLLGKVDATSDRDAGVLRVDAVHEDEPWPGDVRDAVRAELASLSGWLRLELELR